MGDVIIIDRVLNAIENGNELVAKVEGKDREIRLVHRLSPRQIEIVKEGGLINWVRKLGGKY